MRRFFIEPQNVHSGTVELNGPEAHHVVNVLRLKPGDLIELFDGLGNIYEAKIDRTAKGLVETTIISSRFQSPATPIVHMAQAMLKGKKMDFLVQKACELGIDAIHPFKAKFCALKEQAGRRESRWRRIALEACKQCGRPMPLEIAPFTDLDSLLAAAGNFESKLICWEKEGERFLGEIFTSPLNVESVMIVVGPEGGFAEDEIGKAKDAGFQPVGLGGRILRAETASFAVMTILQFMLGHLGRNIGGEG